MSLFDPNSKFMLYVRVLGDMIILNVLFIICSIPIITIGAAKSGLYTGLRELFDRESSNSPSKSFFKGFKNGFVKISGIWTFALVCIAALCYCIYFLYHAIEQEVIQTNIPIITAIIGLLLFCINISQLVVFHSKFDCKPMLLIRNTIVMVIGFPIRTIAIAVVSWLPVVLFLFNSYIFFLLSPMWFGVYFAFSGYLVNSFMKKPFDKIIYPNGKPEDSEEDKENENGTEKSEEQ